MPATEDLALLLEVAQEAGEIAARHFGASPRVWDKGGGQGPVTAADLEIDAMLRARLTAARPGYGWLSEESTARASANGDAPLFIIDPIDGTRAFIDGQKGFAHALAVLEGGVPQAAVVFLPMLGQAYTAARGQGAWLNDARLNVREPVAGVPPAILATRSQFEPGHWPRGVPEVARHFRASLAHRLALVAAGQFDAMLSLRPTWHWDIAAGALLVTEAGGVVSDGQGAPLRFGTPEPKAPGIIAAAPDLQARLVARRQPV